MKRLTEVLENQGIETSSVMVKFTKDGELKAQFIYDSEDSNRHEGEEESERNRGKARNEVLDDGKLPPFVFKEASSKERERQLEMEIDGLRSQISQLLQQKDELGCGRNCNASEDKPKYSMVSVLSI